MKKQILSFVTISSILITLAITASALSTFRLKVNVPFDFTVGKTSLPAGLYRVDNNLNRGLLTINGINVNKNISSNSFRGASSRHPSRAMLVFHRYGNQYFLSQIWGDGSTESVQIPESSAERELTKNSKYLARNRVEPEIVTIPAQ